MANAHKIFIRSKKEDSAFIYHILEANEGLAAYSTLAFQPTDPHRDLELLVPPELVTEIEALLTELKEIVTILPDPSSTR